VTGRNADPAAVERYRAAWGRHQAAAEALPDVDRVPADPDREPTRAMAEFGDAADGLLEAAEAIHDVVDAVWEENRQAVTDAKRGVREAIEHALEVELATAVAARRRNPLDPVRSEDELAACRAAFEAYVAAGAAHDQALAAFKAGVTPEQVEARG
jgi:hypothetical protein